MPAQGTQHIRTLEGNVIRLADSALIGGEDIRPISGGLSVNDGTTAAENVTTLVAPGADIATPGEARVQGVDAHNGLTIAFTDTHGLNVALSIDYVGEPADFIPLLGIGVDQRQVFFIDSSGDSDHYFLATTISHTYHVKYDAVNFQLMKIGEFGVGVSGPMGDLLFIDPTAGTVSLPHLPTSDPHALYQLWNDAGTLKISAG